MAISEAFDIFTTHTAYTKEAMVQELLKCWRLEFSSFSGKGG